MARNMRVISGDKDGADLRREKLKSQYYTRCDNKSDDREINDAIQSVGRGKAFSIPAGSWERIFGGQE